MIEAILRALDDGLAVDAVRAISLASRAPLRYVRLPAGSQEESGYCDETQAHRTLPRFYHRPSELPMAGSPT